MLRNRKLIVVVALTILLVSAGFATAAMTLSAQDLLVAALTNAEATTDGSAVLEFEATTPEMDGNGSMAVWGQLDAGPNGEPAFRVEILSSSMDEAPVGLTAVGDGITLWVWEPTENVVFTGTYEEIAEAMMAQMSQYAEEHEGEFEPPADMPEEFDEEAIPDTPEEAVAKLLEYVTADRDGMADIAGEEAYQVRLVPIAEQMPEEMRAIGGLFNVWVRAEDKAPLGAEFTGSAAGSAAIRATSLTINEGIPAGTFTFDIPADAEIITVEELEAWAAEKAAAMETAVPADMVVLTPATLPADAVLADELTIRGAAVQRYERDGGSFTFAQGAASAAGDMPTADATAVTVRGVDGLSYTDADNGRSLLTWEENGVTYWIGGDITPEEALALAESLE